MKKRGLACLLVFILFFTLVPLPNAMAAEKIAFNDISQTAWYAGQVYALAERDIVSGTSATTFSPDRAVTRAEFLKLLAAAVLSPEELEEYRSLAIFEDVPAGEWFAPYVNWGFQNEIAYGYSESLFLPNGLVTREEAAAFMVRFAETYPDKAVLKEKRDPFSFSDDAAISRWAAYSVSACQQAMILSGYRDGSFRPRARTTRGEAAVMLCALLEIKPLDKSEIPAPPDPYFDVKQKLAALKQKFPDGKYWNHRTSATTAGKQPWEIVTDTPCYHAGYGTYYCNEYQGASSVPVIGGTWSRQCLGFASMISDQIFGKDAPVRTFREFDKLRPGDQIRLFDDVHSMVVVEKAKDYITVAEVNADYSTCKITWGRKISKKSMESHGGNALYITRYKD